MRIFIQFLFAHFDCLMLFTNLHFLPLSNTFVRHEIIGALFQCRWLLLPQDTLRVSNNSYPV